MHPIYPRCGPLVLVSSMSLFHTLWAYDPFGLLKVTSAGASFAENLMRAARVGDPIHILDIPGEVL